MKNLYILLLPVIFFCLACKSSISSVNKLFGKKTPHEAYASTVDNSPEGQQWVAVSKSVLDNPHTIALPYKQRGVFPAGKPRAMALRFSARQGERVNFELIKKSATGFVIYADLYRLDGTGVSHFQAVDTASNDFCFDVNEAGNYILRLQPELYRSGEYNLAVSVTPSLGFPVAGTKAKIGSFWGDARDGGHRSHEGLDIFAPKLTPAIAAADGFITRVADGGIGGKTVWVRVADRDISLYYAHLDQQLVEEGQLVKKGDTLGLVGNTGNAKHTPPHLHFGVYGFGGAIDPLPYVNNTVKKAPALPEKDLDRYLTFKKIKKGLPADTLVPLAITSKGYLAESGSGNIIHTSFADVKVIKVGS